MTRVVQCGGLLVFVNEIGIELREDLVDVLMQMRVRENLRRFEHEDLALAIDGEYAILRDADYHIRYGVGVFVPKSGEERIDGRVGEYLSDFA